MIIVLYVFISYLVGMVAAGIVTVRLVSKSLDDFILVGRKLWIPVLALSER